MGPGARVELAWGKALLLTRQAQSATMRQSQMVAGDRIELSLAMGYEPMLETNILPASNWRPWRDSNSQNLPVRSRTPYPVWLQGHNWWIGQVLTLRPPGLHSGALGGLFPTQPYHLHPCRRTS